MDVKFCACGHTDQSHDERRGGCRVPGVGTSQRCRCRRDRETVRRGEDHYDKVAERFRHHPLAPS